MSTQMADISICAFTMQNQQLLLRKYKHFSQNCQSKKYRPRLSNQAKRQDPGAIAPPVTQ
jgi:hypothetical protein